MKKNFITFRKNLRTKELTMNEMYLVELFFEYHNDKYGYAFPTFKQILEACGSPSKSTLVKLIKSLEDKGILEVDRSHKNNRYTIVDIEKYLIVGEVVIEPVKDIEDVVTEVVAEGVELSRNEIARNIFIKSIQTREVEITQTEVMPYVSVLEILDGKLDDYVDLVTRYGVSSVRKALEYAYAGEEPYLRIVIRWLNKWFNNSEVKVA